MKPTAPRARMRRVSPGVRRVLRAARLSAGETVLVAVSGGADSSALLLVLHALTREHGLRLHAAHLHHGLRGHEADLDRDHVRSLCVRLGVPLTDARIEARARMRARSLSGEAGLRTLRREWLARVARRVGAVAVATGHTADDQLETLLLRVARGAGLTGLGGMRPVRGRWLKPLLDCPRLDVELDLRDAGVEWREDSSNRDLAIARNRVRHQVVPALLATLHGADATPTQRAAMARRAATAAAEARAARVALRRVLRGLSPGALALVGDLWRLDARALRAQPLAVRREAVDALWRSARAGEHALPLAVRDALARSLATGRGGRRWALPGGAWAERKAGALWLRPRGAGSPGRMPSTLGAKGIARGRTKSSGDAILPPRHPGRRRPATDGSPDHRDARPDTPMDTARRSLSGHERKP